MRATSARVEEACADHHVLRCDIGSLEESVHRRVEVDLVGTSVERRALKHTAPPTAGSAVAVAHQRQARGDLMGSSSHLGVGRTLVQRLQFALVVTLAGRRPIVRPCRWWREEWPRTAEGDTSVLTVGGRDEKGRRLVEGLGFAPERSVRIAGPVASQGRIRHYCVLSARSRRQAEEIGLPDVVQHLFGRHDSRGVELDAT